MDPAAALPAELFALVLATPAQRELLRGACSVSRQWRDECFRVLLASLPPAASAIDSWRSLIRALAVHELVGGAAHLHGQAHRLLQRELCHEARHFGEGLPTRHPVVGKVDRVEHERRVPAHMPCTCHTHEEEDARVEWIAPSV